MAEEPASATDDARSGGEDAGLATRVAKGASFGFVGRLGSKVLAVALQVLLTRTLGTSQYGLYVLGKTVTDTGRNFAQLGLRQGALRYGARYLGDDDERLATVLGWALLCSVAAGLAMAGGLYVFAEPLAVRVFDDPAMERVLKLFSFGVPFYVLMALSAAFFQAFERIDREQLLRNVTRPVTNILLVGGAFAVGLRLEGAIAGFVLAGAASAALGTYLLFRVHDAPVSLGLSAGDRETVRRLLIFSLSMMLITMSGDLARRTDRLMLGMFDAAETVGVYNVAATLSLQFSVVLSSLIGIFKPMVADMSVDDDVDRMAALYRTVTKWSSYATLALFAVVASFPALILSVFGASFTAGRAVLYVLPLMYVTGALFGPCGALLTMTGRQKVELANGLALVTLNVVLNLFLIPVYGALGAAAAVVVAATAVNAVQVTAVYVLYGFHPFTFDHLAVVGVAVAVVATVVWSSTTLALLPRALVCGGLVLSCGLLFYRQSDAEERALLRGMLSRE